MKAHIPAYKSLLRATPDGRRTLVFDTPLELIQEVAENGVGRHLAHYRARGSELLASAPSAYVRGRVFEVLARNSRSFGQAKIAYRASIALEEMVGPSWNALGILECQAGNPIGAESFFAQAVQAGYREASIGLGWLEPHLGSFGLERERLYRAAFPTDDPLVHLDFGWYLKNSGGSLEEAEKYLQNAVNLGEPQAAVNLGTVQRDLGKREEAVESMVLGAVYDVDSAIPNLLKLGLTMHEIEERVAACRASESFDFS